MKLSIFKVVSSILPLILALLLSVFVIKFSTFNANNDAYLQLLAVEGIIEGKGYGFWQNSEFYFITSRSAQTRWPPGLTLIACLVYIIGLDPLISLMRIYPILIFISYLLLFLILKKIFHYFTASIIAFASMTPLCVLQWYKELGTEPFAFLLCIILFGIIIHGQISQDIEPYKLFLLVVVSITLTMFRTAGFFFLPISFLLYSLFWLKEWKTRIKFIIGGGLIAILPILLFHILSNGGTILPRLDLKHFLFLIDELNKNIATWSEIVIIRSVRLWRYKRIMILLGWIIFSIIFIYVKITWKSFVKNVMPIETKRRYQVLVTGLGWGISYAVFLSLSAFLYSYRWSEVYRVSGFSLPWMILAFSSCLLLIANRRPWIMKVIVLGILLLSMMKYGYAWRCELLYDVSKKDFFKDYRSATEHIVSIINQNCKQIDMVYIFAGGHWSGRNLLRMLWYYDKFYKKLPWKVMEIKHFNEISQAISNCALIVMKKDIKVIKLLFKLHPLWRYCGKESKNSIFTIVCYE